MQSNKHLEIGKAKEPNCIMCEWSNKKMYCGDKGRKANVMWRAKFETEQIVKFVFDDWILKTFKRV